MSTLKVNTLEPEAGDEITITSGKNLRMADVASKVLGADAQGDIVAGSSYTVGTGAENLVRLGSSSELPVVSGAQLTALNATQITSGTIPDDARLPTVGIDKGGTGTTTGLNLLKHQLFTNGTRTAISQGAQVLWTVSFTKLQTSSTLVVKATMQGHGMSSGCATEYIEIGGTKYRSISYRYCTSWADANFQMQGTAEKAGDTAGTVSIKVGWDNNGIVMLVWNPNSTDESRNSQLVSTIEVMEIA
tara:strand:- start:273 stop:1010 length:738 start_codon:yes stop_codon:yes gene_type:complete